MVQAQPLQSGWWGSAGPHPQEGKAGLEAGDERTPAHPGPGQTDSEADRWSQGRAASPPVWGRAPRWAERSSQGPGHALQQRGKGEPPGCRDPLVWRRERGQKTGQLPPRRDPGEEGRSPDRGSPERRRTATARAGPQSLNPHKKGLLLPGNIKRWQSRQKKPLGSAWADTPPPRWGEHGSCAKGPPHSLKETVPTLPPHT